MEIKIPHIVKTISLGEYAPEFEGASVQVWVNPPRDMLLRRGELMQQAQDAKDPATLEQIGNQIIDWYAELWSQGPEGTHISAEEIHTLIEQVNDTDPLLWGWLTGKSIELIVEHRSQKKKG